MQETPVRFLGQEDPLEKGWLPTPVFLGQVQSMSQEDPLEKEMATFTRIPGNIPWTEELGGLQSLGLQRVRHD